MKYFTQKKGDRILPPVCKYNFNSNYPTNIVTGFSK